MQIDTVQTIPDEVLQTIPDEVLQTIPDEVLQTIQLSNTTYILPESEKGLKKERTKHFIKIVDAVLMTEKRDDLTLSVLERLIIPTFQVVSIPTSKSCIEYTVYFPKKIQIGVHDIMNDCEPLYMDQELPLKVDCITYFKYNFNSKINCTDYIGPNDISSPYTMRSCWDRNKRFAITILNSDDINNGDYISTITIRIKYIIDPTVELNHRINKLVKIVNHNGIIAERNIQTINKQKVEIYKRSNTDNVAATAMQNLIIFRKLYETHNIKNDCPVCYEVIKPSALMMPACGHYICKSCIVKCKGKCPICRACYNRYDKIN
jgi:hypothetical protein